MKEWYRKSGYYWAITHDKGAGVVGEPYPVYYCASTKTLECIADDCSYECDLTGNTCRKLVGPLPDPPKGVVIAY